MDIDRSKENIQPLRGGRNPAHLGAALNASADADAARRLQQRCREHEALIAAYDGPDPLEPWFDYVQWVEQCFPKNGHEGHIHRLIEECLTKFENDERYAQDRRFLKLWIKYIGHSEDPLEFYRGLYSRGIGTELSELYRAWACYTEEAEDYAKADQIYNLGLQNGAEPRDELEQAYREFQFGCAQRFLHDDSPTKRKAESALTETRLALTTLRTVKRRNTTAVPSQRTGENVASAGPGTLRPNSDVPSGSRGNVAIDIYNDKPGPSLPIPERSATPSGTAPSLLRSISTVENQKEIGMWSNSSKKLDGAETKKMSANPVPFALFEDDRLTLPPNFPTRCEEDFSDFRVPVCVPDPPDPTKIPQYDKKEVYKEAGSDATEFSLEEIKARKYIQKYKSKKDDGAARGNFEEPSSDNKNEFKIENVIAQSNSILNAEDQHNDFNASLLADLHGNDSMTFHTKEAHRELNLFTENNDSFDVAEFEPLKFDIREDHSMTMAAARVKVETKAENDPESNIENEKLNSDFVENKPATDENYYGQHNFQSMNDIQNAANFDITSTAIFSGNVPSASTPCNNYFKTPQMVDSVKRIPMKSFDIAADAEGGQDKFINQIGYAVKDNCNKQNIAMASADVNRMGNNNELYPIMETTRENRSSSSSSGCNQTSGNVPFGYAARESSGQTLNVKNEKSHENVAHEGYYHQYQDPNAYHKRQNGAVFKGNVTQNQIMHKDEPHATMTSSQNNLSTPTQYHSLDHQYHKQNPAFNRYNVQNVPRNYQGINQLSAGNGGYQNHVTYQNSPVNNHAYHPTAQQNYNQHAGYQNNQQPIQDFQNSSFANTPDYHNPQNVQQGYQNVQHHNYQNNHHNYAAAQGYQNSTQNSFPQQHYNSNHQTMLANSQQNYTNPQQGFASPQHGYNSPQHNYSNPQHGFTGQHGQQHAFASPQHGFTSPQHGFTSPQHGFTSPQHGFTSPQHNYMNSQQGYSSPQQGFTSPQHVYSNTQQGYQKHYPQHVYSGSHVQAAGFQSPPHVAQSYNSHHSVQNTSHNYVNSPNVNAMHINQQYQQHYYQNDSNNVQTPVSQNHAKPQMNMYNNYNIQNQPNYSMYKNVNNLNSSQVQFQESVQASRDYPSDALLTQNQQCQNITQNASNSFNQNQLNNYPPQKQVAVNRSSNCSQLPPEIQQQMYQSSTAKLRSVRHEVPNVAGKLNNGNVSNTTNNASSPVPNPGYSTQYLNFISSRNEPKDNANTPKFSNSPTMSQKMHKNLYVSSPEQGQIPPNTDNNNAEMSKESALQTSLSNQSRNLNISNIKDRYKEQPKRQLDFEIRPEIQSEDSRDSMGKVSRISSAHSRQSIQSMHTDGENSTDSSMAFRSNLDNSTISTQDIPLPADIQFPAVIDPFNLQLCNSLLQYVKFPNKNHYEGYYEAKTIGKFQQGFAISLGRSKYTLDKQLGKGTFGSVFKATDHMNNELVALKHQKPPHPWEYYICQEIKARIKDNFMLPGYMDIRVAVFNETTSVFVSELSIYGSLLDVANKIKTATTKCISEFIVMLMASEMLSIVHHLHKVQIIHGDIKPDNFLVMKTPQTESRAPSLQLIDFGCAIDMSLFPEGTTFKKVISTDGFTCTEMRDGRPWTYQTDLYCLAGTVYVILMGNYMQTAKRGGQWVVEKKWPRYMKSEVWDKIFTPLLNVKDCSSIPDLLSLKAVLDEFLISVDSNLSTQLRTFDHILKRK